jgi:hypothetical protein
MIYRSKGKTETEILHLSHHIPMDLFRLRFPRFPRFICFSRVTHTPIQRFVPEEKNIDRSISLSGIQPIITANCQLPIRSNGQSIVTTIKDIPNPIIKIILNTYLPEFDMSLAEKIIGDAVLHGCVDVFEYINSVIGFDFSNSRDYYLNAVRSNNVAMVKYLYSNGFPIEKGVFEKHNLVSCEYYMVACEFGNMRMIEYLYSMGFPLKESLFSKVVERNDIKIVLWLISKKCPFWGFEFERAYINGLVDMFNLLFLNGYYELSYKMTKYVIRKGDLNTLKLLYSKKFPVDILGCSIIAAQNKDYDIIDFMVCNNLFLFDYKYEACRWSGVQDDVLVQLERRYNIYVDIYAKYSYGYMRRLH